MKQSFTKEIRAFNRFYTNIIGLLDRHILDSNYSLPEVRILYELYHHSGLTASDIIALLDIDKGYLSRILRRFEKHKLVNKVTSSTDKRSASIKLTAKGNKEFENLDSASNKQIEEVFGNLTESECTALIQKFTEIQQILNNKK
ncbi:MAG: winged helix-turn-helix transcriptional regulator [Chitinophagaceae bacterium]|nr:winged helix-turn-helix transcriptional regulator [Chitinophagaceae bacterium]